MLALLHDFCSDRSKGDQVEQACAAHQSNGYQGTPPVLFLEYSSISSALSCNRTTCRGQLLTWPCQSQKEREDCLESEVGREDGLLQRAELCPRKGLVCQWTVHEGLEEVRSEQSAIGDDMVHLWVAD